MSDLILPNGQPMMRDPRDAPVVFRTKAYIPELDYAARDYKPFSETYKTTIRGKTEKHSKLPPNAEHFCQRCVKYYNRLAANNLFPKGEWSMPCKGDAAWRARGYTQQDLDQLGLDSQEDIDYFLMSLDPSKWIEYEFGIRLDWYQVEMMNCTNSWKAARAGRRIGKTMVLGCDICYKCYFKRGIADKYRYEYLIICPYEAQVKKIFDNLDALIQLSPNMQASIKGMRKSPHWELEWNNGSIVRGFSSGRKTGARSEKVRGQDADDIGFDEIDYMADDDIEAILAVVGSNEEVGLWMSTTPTGARTKFHSVCTDKTQGFKEFHYISEESPRWNPRAEKLFRAMYSDSGYMREFHAEFGTPSEGVFRQDDLDMCLRDYTYNDCKWRPGCIYVLGVDWNKLTGTHLVVVEFDPKRTSQRYAVVDKKIIRKSEFTQHEGVDAIVQLDKKWRCSHIYVDQGYGDTQVEMLQMIDKKYPQLGTRYRQRVRSVNMGEKIEISDPLRPGDVIKKAAKPFMIDLLAGWIGMQEVIFPQVEDTSVSIIETELAYLDVGMVQQMRDFRVEAYSPTGQPRYTQGYEHTLIALALACMAHALTHSELKENFIDNGIHYSPRPFGEPRPQEALESGLQGEDLEAERQKVGKHVRAVPIHRQLAPARKIPGESSEVDVSLEYHRLLGGGAQKRSYHMPRGLVAKPKRTMI